MEHISYADFGAAFVLAAVTPERIQGVLGDITGEQIAVGPLRAGPGGAATATAVGRVGPAQTQRVSIEPLEYRLTLPVTLTLNVDVAGVNHAFTGDLTVNISLTVRTAAPLTILVEVGQVRSSDVTSRVQAKGLRAKALALIGDLDGELRRHVATYVNERVSSPEARGATTIDLLPIMAEAWQ